MIDFLRRLFWPEKTVIIISRKSEFGPNVKVVNTYNIKSPDSNKKLSACFAKAFQIAHPGSQIEEIKIRE